MTAQLILTAFLAGTSILVAWAHTFAQNKENGRYIRHLHDQHQLERDQWMRERQLLLNRIKPETAQFVPDPNISPVMPQAIPFDDDEALWAAQGISTEDLAERMMQDELRARVE